MNALDLFGPHTGRTVRQDVSRRRSLDNLVRAPDAESGVFSNLLRSLSASDQDRRCRLWAHSGEQDLVPSPVQRNAILAAFATLKDLDIVIAVDEDAHRNRAENMNPQLIQALS